MPFETTVIIWDTCGLDKITFYVKEGDLRKFNGVYVNENGNDLEEELMECLQGDHSALDHFPVDEVKKGAFVIVCGFLP